MGEMLLMHHKDNVPLIIIRPTMITSTSKDPFPGWIEGQRYMHFTIHKYFQNSYSISYYITMITMYIVVVIALTYDCRTVDSMICAYGKGKLPCFLDDPKTILDIVSCMTKFFLFLITRQ